MLDREGTITLDTRRQALTHVEAWYGLGRDCGVPWCLRWIRNCRLGGSGDLGCVHCTSAHGQRCAHLHRQEVTHLSFAKSLSARSSGALICSAPSSSPLRAHPSPRPSWPLRQRTRCGATTSSRHRDTDRPVLVLPDHFETCTPGWSKCPLQRKRASPPGVRPAHLRALEVREGAEHQTYRRWSIL